VAGSLPLDGGGGYPYPAWASYVDDHRENAPPYRLQSQFPSQDQYNVPQQPSSFDSLDRRYMHSLYDESQGSLVLPAGETSSSSHLPPSAGGNPALQSPGPSSELGHLASEGTAAGFYPFGRDARVDPYPSSRHLEPSAPAANSEQYALRQVEPSGGTEQLRRHVPLPRMALGSVYRLDQTSRGKPRLKCFNELSSDARFRLLARNLA